MNDPVLAPRARRNRRRIVIGLAACLAGAVLGAALGPGDVAADNTVLSSQPEDGATLETSPTAIVVNFVEELGEQNTLSVQCNADLVALPRADVGDDDRSLIVEIDSPLPRGGCIVAWAVSNTDNEPNGSGNITFTIQNDPATPASTTADTGPPTTDATATTTPATTTPGDPEPSTSLSNVESGRGPLWLGRLLSTLGIAVVFGSLVTIAAAWPEGVEYLLAVRFVRSAWIVAMLGTVLYVSAGAAAVNDTGLGSGFSPGAWLDLVDAGWSGRAALARLVLITLSAWVAFRPDRAIDPTTQLAALGVPALAVVAIGVARTDGDLAALGVAMGVIHALAAAVWVGGAVLVARVVLAGPGEEDLVHAVRGFSRISNPAIAVTVVSGLVQMVRLDGGDLFTSGHGRVVVLKTVVVALMIFVAVSARQFVSQRMSRAEEMSVPLADRLRRAFGTEAAVGIVVLALSAWLLALDPPQVDTTPSIDYAIERTIEVPDGDLDLTIKLTRDRVGAAGMEVEVRLPETGLSALEVIFTAPPNEDIGTITQPVPLTGAGVAVRLVSSGGLPFDVAGDWTVQVNAITPSGVVNSDPVQFTILERDGSAPTTAITIPPVSIVTLPSTTIEE